MNWLKKIFTHNQDASGLKSSKIDSLPKTIVKPCVDDAKPLIKVDLFSLLGDQPLVGNIKAMFDLTRKVVGGRILLIDITYENGTVLRNVRIQNEHEIEVPCNFKTLPIKEVGVPNFKRQTENKAMYEQKK